jgi:hypothetical protein
MQYVKENGKFRFTPDEWLTAKQIKSFFSTLTKTRRKKSNIKTTRKKSVQKEVVSGEISHNHEKFVTSI